MSTEIIKLINLRDNYLRQFRKSKNQSDYELFIYHRNQVKYKKEKDKSQYCTYYINVVNENKNRPKKTMANVERGCSSTKCKTKESSISLDTGKELCIDKVKVATHFNDFFSSNILLPLLLTTSQRILFSLVKATFWNCTVINMSQNICLVCLMYIQDRCLRYCIA